MDQSVPCMVTADDPIHCSGRNVEGNMSTASRRAKKERRIDKYIRALNTGAYKHLLTSYDLSTKPPLTVKTLMEALDKLPAPLKSIQSIYVSEECWKLLTGKRVIDILLTFNINSNIPVFKNPNLVSGYMIHYTDETWELHP